MNRLLYKLFFLHFIVIEVCLVMFGNGYVCFCAHSFLWLATYTDWWLSLLRFSSACALILFVFLSFVSWAQLLRNLFAINRSHRGLKFKLITIYARKRIILAHNYNHRQISVYLYLTFPLVFLQTKSLDNSFTENR